MTQEEFEDIVNKTCEMFLNYRPKAQTNSVWEDLRDYLLNPNDIPA